MAGFGSTFSPLGTSSTFCSCLSNPSHILPHSLQIIHHVAAAVPILSSGVSTVYSYSLCPDPGLVPDPLPEVLSLQPPFCTPMTVIMSNWPVPGGAWSLISLSVNRERSIIMSSHTPNFYNEEVHALTPNASFLVSDTSCFILPATEC